jgi:hypothetical protein
LIVRDGMAAPDSGPQGVFVGGYQPQINNAGQLVFFSSVLESPLANSLPGIFAYSVVGDYLWSIRAGDELEVADNDFRTVSNVQLPDGLSDFGVNTTDGHRSSLNDAGQLVFIAQFTDQSSGVFVATLPPATGLALVPEPTTAALLAVGAIALLACNRRRAGKERNRA